MRIQLSLEGAAGSSIGVVLSMRLSWAVVAGSLWVAGSASQVATNVALSQGADGPATQIAVGWHVSPILAQSSETRAPSPHAVATEPEQPAHVLSGDAAIS
jgi:hypothetical protein